MIVYCRSLVCMGIYVLSRLLEEGLESCKWRRSSHMLQNLNIGERGHSILLDAEQKALKNGCDLICNYGDHEGDEKIGKNIAFWSPCEDVIFLFKSYNTIINHDSCGSRPKEGTQKRRRDWYTLVVKLLLSRNGEEEIKKIGFSITFLFHNKYNSKWSSSERLQRICKVANMQE